MRVGLFDSGVGGLTVLRKLIDKYPLNDYIYYGDTLNVPYGNKSKDELYKLSSKIIEFFVKEEVDLVVIACGTISSNCYLKLKNNYNINIIDIISPTIKYIREKKYDSIGVLATSMTVNSHIFKNSLDIDVYEEDCQEFVFYIENNQYDRIDVDSHIKNINSDIIVLGCTHFPLFRYKINKECIDMADNIRLLENEGNGKVILYFSKLDDNIIKNINIIMNKKLNICEKNI